MAIVMRTGMGDEWRVRGKAPDRSVRVYMPEKFAGAGLPCVEIDGHDVTTMVRRISFEAAAGDLVEVTLTLAPDALMVDLDKTLLNVRTEAV